VSVFCRELLRSSVVSSHSLASMYQEDIQFYVVTREPVVPNTT